MQTLPRLPVLAVAFYCLFSVFSDAGTYGTQTFTAANGTTSLGDGTTINSNTGTASIQSNALRLTANGTGNTSASFKLPDLDVGKEIQSFDVTYKLRLFASSTPADGYTLNFGAIPAGDGSGEGGFVMPNGLVIAWDTYNNGNDAPSIEVFCNGTSVGNFPQTFNFDGAYRTVSIHWDAAGLDVTFNGVAICTNLPTSGFNPISGNKFAFSARTGGATEEVSIDDLFITTAPVTPLDTGGPVISEFMAQNKDTYEDEDTDASDWIEIYNGQNTTVNLSGWRLTNEMGNLSKWTFPSLSLGPYQYRIVFASGKNRTAVSGQLHTNFTLEKDGGYLALVNAAGTIVSQFSYGVQAEDVSYGEAGAARTIGFLEPATPGDKNLSNVADGAPAEDVQFSREGGLITGTTTLTITAPVASGSTIRYTTNNTVPNESSAIYNPAAPPAAFTFSNTSTFRVRVYTPGHLPGHVSSRTFLRLDSTLTNYAGSGTAFDSSLPIIVMDSLGIPVDSYTDPSQLRPYRPTYAVAIDKSPVNGRASIVASIADFQGRGATHVRGESSSSFPQRSYSWETWDNEDRDKDAAILGLPSESDWALYAPYTDKTLMRNFITFTRMRELKPEGAMRTKFVELFFNQEAGQPVSYNDYRGVYVLMERIKIAKNRVNLTKLNSLTTAPSDITGGYIFKKDKPSVGNASWSTATYGIPLQAADPEVLNSAQNSALQGMINSFESALAGANFGSPTAGYQAHIDRDSFIDNWWFVEIAKNIDGYRLSTYYSKDRGGKIRNLPLWDYNLSLANADYLAGDQPTGWYYTQTGGTDYPWYSRLFQDPDYKVRHWDRYWELRRSIYDTSTVLGAIDTQAALLQENSAASIGNNQHPALRNPVARHFTKWPILGTYIWPNGAGYASRVYYKSGNATTGEVDSMKAWLSSRLAWLDDQNFVGSVIYRPPVFSASGGIVDVGTQVTINRYTGTAPAGYSYATGTLYYTTNGTDPRSPSGSPAGSVYSSPVTLNASTILKARLYNAGAWSPVTTSTYIASAVPASAANLVISELQFNPMGPSEAEIALGYTSGNDFEYVELLNVGSENVDLSGVHFSEGIDFDFATVTDPALLTLPPGGRILLVGNLNAFHYRYGNNPAVKIAGAYSGNLANGGEPLTLLAANNAIIAQFTYGDAEPWPVDADGSGYSLVLNKPAGGPAYGTGTSWRASAELGGTPGLPDSIAFTGSYTADTDADGMCDFLEYACGTNARPACTLAPFTVGQDTKVYLRFDFRRNLSADGAMYAVQFSPDLVSWSTAPADVTYVSTHNNGDGTATVIYRTTQPASALGSHAYLRLRVTPQ